ncbi:unnamed protein product [Effrenium voratum]|uniref:Uncharacterized protein n=1 Tax=Effrenium voratum TaxID=2562239 RepID=A0AA36MYZ6_9DINO|nr:unnamed protein product [Effrenium voratum]CAJ1385814.1 unnamed protein product [Effrenium voratum]CAJ1450084.1 unnamed protein product [Effrenium voratum]CAJ1453486.1 unnamed protein product [Effrenium voratum]
MAAGARILEPEDLLSEARSGPADGKLPVTKADIPGMTCMTLEVPSVQSKDAWNSFLQLLSLADGIVILRMADDAAHDQEGYLAKSPLLAEVYEIVESRPMFIVCVCKGPVRASLMTFVGISQLVVATSEATFGLPKYRHDLHPMTSIALKKRLMEKAVRRLELVGDPIDANEAQRLGMVDFVGSEVDVENELSRLIYRNCSPSSQYFMYKSDLVKAMREREEA